MNAFQKFLNLEVCLPVLAHSVAPASPNTVLKRGTKHTQLRAGGVRIMGWDAFLYLWAESGERQGQHGKQIHLVPVSVLPSPLRVSRQKEGVSPSWKLTWWERGTAAMLPHAWGLPMQITLPLAALLWRLSNPASSQWHCWPWPLGQVKAEGEAALETSARYPKLWRCPQQPSREARCCCHFLVGGGDHIDNKPLFD